jgi:hypothetical protein
VFRGIREEGSVHKALIGRFEPYFMHSDPNHHVLERGDDSPACANVKVALIELGIARSSGANPKLFDEELSDAVRSFQSKNGHRNGDGRVGPGTRALLVSEVLEAFPASWFDRLDRSDVKPTVFLSYAWSDSSKVDKLDQWLRDNGVRVIRDTHDFTAGSNLTDNILKSVSAADKTIAVYSHQSNVRDWPSFERQIAEQIEKQVKTPVLIYLCLDETPLKKYDPHRIAIFAKEMTLKRIGQEILKALNLPRVPPRYDYNEDEPL